MFILSSNYTYHMTKVISFKYTGEDLDWLKYKIFLKISNITIQDDLTRYIKNTVGDMVMNNE